MTPIQNFQLAAQRKGTVLVLVSFLLVVILGVLAFAIDGGLLLDNRRRVQGAADAAALAAANQLFINYPAIADSNYHDYDPNGAARAAALAYSSTNGFANGTITSVTVNIPPASGPFSGKAGYAEVVLVYNQKRMFSQIWSNAVLPVRARAVARGRWGDTGKGIITLDPVNKSTLNASGTGNINVTGGSAVVVNSTHTEAAVVTGGGSITAASFEIAGGYTGTLNGPAETGVPPQPDPLRYLPAPTIPPAGVITKIPLASGNKLYTLSPGLYTTLPNFNSGDVVIFQQASVNSVGGIFYFQSCGFKSTGASILMDPYSTGGIMIYNAPGGTSANLGIDISGNSSGTVYLSGLTDGPYAGLLFFQERSAPQDIKIVGGGNFTMLGTFYAANALLSVTGNGDAVIGSQYISRTLSISGNGNITINYSADATGRLRESLLVE